MSNLNKTQAQFDAVFKRIAVFKAFIEKLQGLADFFLLGRTLVTEEFDQSNFVQDWVINGAVRGTNTDQAGKLYVSITDESPGAGQATVDVYKDPAKAAPDRVMTGSAADDATITLTAVNSSGMTGTVKLNTVTANDTDIVLTLTIDLPRRVVDLFNVDAADLRTNSLLTEELRDRGEEGTADADSLVTFLSDNYLLTDLRNFIQSDASGVLSQVEEILSDGEIKVTKSGVLVDLSDVMADNTIAQSVRRNVLNAPSGTFDPDNVGVGSITDIVLQEYVLSGVVRLVCTDETIGTEKFSVSLIRTDGTILTTLNSATVKSIFRSSTLGVQLKLIRTITEINDGSNQLSGYIINGETSLNTSQGVLFVTLTNVAGVRTVRLFSDAAKTIKVAEGSGPDGVITLNQVNGSGLTGSAVVAYTVDDLDVEINLNPFKIGDEAYFTVTNDFAGLWQTFFGTRYNFALPSVVSGAETIKEDFAR